MTAFTEQQSRVAAALASASTIKLEEILHGLASRPKMAYGRYDCVLEILSRLGTPEIRRRLVSAGMARPEWFE